MIGRQARGRWAWRAAVSAAAVLLSAGAAAAQTDPASHLVEGEAISLYKLVLLFVLFVLVAVCGNWIAKDVLLIQRQVPMWYGLFIGSSVVSLILVLAIPVFAIGFVMALGAVAGPVAYYVSWRNQRVPPHTKVFTAAHLRRTANRILRREAVGEIAADRAVHIGGAEHISEAYKLLYLRTDDFPIRLSPESEEEQEAFTRGEAVLFEALVQQAEQFHLVPHGAEVLIRYRVDGAVRDGGKLDKKLGEAVIAFVKRLAGLDVQERRKPQTGRFVVLLRDKATTVIAQTAGSVRGEHVAGKLYARELLEMRLEQSGMRPEQVALFHGALDHRGGGVVLMGGPPRSGRTVSMYAAMREFDLFSKNVVAVESEIAIEYAGVRQVAVDKSSGQSLAEAVQGVLRTDPDVVMVETVGDAATAGMMLLGAAAGKVMIGGVQANDVGEAIDKFIELAGDAKSVASTLLAVTNQRLMRTLCEGCREAYRPNPEFLRKANLQAAKVNVLYREPKSRPVTKKGEVVVCPVCRNNGYVGRTAVYEVMVLDDRSRELLATGHTVTEVRTELRKQGQEFLQEEGLRKAVAGATSVAELLRVLKPGK